MKGVLNMVVLEELRTAKGAKIEFHFEEERMHLLDDVTGLQEKLNRLIEDDGVDTGTGSVVHVLINRHGLGRSMRAAEYAEWQAQEKKDWFHSPSDERLDEVLSALRELLGDGLGGRTTVLKIGASYAWPDRNEFVGPTAEEVKEMTSDPENLPKILALTEKFIPPTRCKYCLGQTGLCLDRRASFDLEALKAALAAFQ